MFKSILSIKITTLTILFMLIPACTTTPPLLMSQYQQLKSNKYQEINSNVNTTLSRLYFTIPGSHELVIKAHGILVFPSVVSAGFIVGGQYGEGALRIGKFTKKYYKIVSASFGLQAGAQSKALIFLFMTQESLNHFLNSKGWGVGIDASVAVLKMGANGKIDTNSICSPIQVLALTNAGLMANLTLEGTNISAL